MALSVYDYLDARFGVDVRSRRNPLGLATIAVTATRILPRNPNRYAFLFVNLSAGSIFLLDSPLVSATNGILVAPNGGSVSVSVEEDFSLPAEEWSALAPLGATEFLLISLEGEP